MKKLAWLSLLTAVVVGWYSLRSDDDGGTRAADGGDPALAFDRVWIDHLPRSDRDTFEVFVAVTEQPLGIFDSRSQWKGAWELFRYERRSPGELDVVFPQSRDRARVTVRARACKEKDFDYCLEIGGSPRGAKRYYSRKGWEVGKAAAASPASLRDQVGHLLPAAPAGEAEDEAD